MKLEIKYKLGDEVYVVFKEDDGVVRVFKDRIAEFAMSEKYGLHYFVENTIVEEFNEEELIPIDKHELLIERINKLLESEGKNETN